MKASLIYAALPVLIFAVSSNAFSLKPLKPLKNSTETPDTNPLSDAESIFRSGSASWPKIFDENGAMDTWKEVEELERKILSSIPKIRPFHNFGGLDNFQDNFFKGIDPSQVKNETKHDKKIVDDHVIETDEQSVQSGDKNNRRVLISKSVIIYPKSRTPDDASPLPPRATPGVDEDQNRPVVVQHSKNSGADADDPTKDVELMSAYENPNALKDVDNTITIDEGEPVTYDLSKDVDVNKYVSSATIDPDAELIDKNRIAHNWYSDDKDFDTYKRYNYRSL